MLDRKDIKLEVKKFKYLGSVMSKSGGCQEEIKARMKAALCK